MSTATVLLDTDDLAEVEEILSEAGIMYETRE